MKKETAKENAANQTTRDHRLYDGQTKPFTDLKGNYYENSFWIRGLLCDPYQKILELRNYGFESPEAFEAGGYPFSEIDSGVGSIVFRGAAFDRIVAANPQLVFSATFGMKRIAALVKDYPSADGTECVSFFADAADVPFPDDLEMKK